jgi:hypothetical protein
LRKPNGVTPAARVLDDMGYDIKAVLIEQRAIFGSVQACVIQRFASISSNRLAARRAAGEHERSTRTGVFRENRKHPTLVIRTKVKEAIPCQNAVEPPSRRQRAHISDAPGMKGEMLLTNSDEFGRGVDARNYVPFPDQISGDGLRGAAAKIKDCRSGGLEGKKAIEPRGLSTRRSTTRRATDFRRSECGMLPK